ncbi:NUDIX domain-containing protein [Polaribacter glomeratus]|uniref:GDP-mannose pyrophosphatase n=1 Tax=Polaribacter glomeratus TaxID=102 RepID=A0A2S7WXQ4_9FLAO|nr:NUDIX domain-containing protein [Polaribacter glomeratus]PQJ82360.1 NUDIX domain-containing protein [Polaribacter glomeratus]TXD64539.1 NUDIX domain-containing protein [Polaribacter glomeratus]
MEFKEKISNVTSKVISSFWGTLEHVNFDFRFKNGKSANLTHEVYGKNDGVAILLYNPSTKKVILSKQFRMPVYVAGVSNGFSIELVGGAIDDNESPENCVIRETEEEVGYSVKKVKKVATVFLSPGLMKERTYLYVASYNEDNKVDNGGGLASENEEIEVLETSFKTALKMIETEEIIDARTIMMLQYLQINRLI